MTPTQIDHILDMWCREYLWNMGAVIGDDSKDFTTVGISIDKTLPALQLAVVGPGWRAHRDTSEMPFRFVVGTDQDFLRTAAKLRLVAEKGDRYFDLDLVTEEDPFY